MEQLIIPKILDTSLKDIISIETNSKNRAYKAVLRDNFVFIKQVKNNNLAKQEYSTQNHAFQLLKSYGLKVPQII